MMSNHAQAPFPSPYASQPMVSSHSAPHLGNHVDSQTRFRIYLEAPTASGLPLEESPITYLNKGQYYLLDLKDRQGESAEMISTLTITFHDEPHRLSAKDYWNFWLTQQEVEEPKAVEVGK
ncbi:CP2 transcription factor-domain-containing protein [Sporodiniella umbellata]|nr:CP2 transcription factor-domain-containing protein [Sporodiniella umbellata]